MLSAAAILHRDFGAFQHLQPVPILMVGVKRSGNSKAGSVHARAEPEGLVAKPGIAHQGPFPVNCLSQLRTQPSAALDAFRE
jgi:hypothetical protein